jgi:hypothetical protein
LVWWKILEEINNQWAIYFLFFKHGVNKSSKSLGKTTKDERRNDYA